MKEKIILFLFCLLLIEGLIFLVLGTSSGINAAVIQVDQTNYNLPSGNFSNMQFVVILAFISTLISIVIAFYIMKKTTQVKSEKKFLCDISMEKIEENFKKISGP